MRAWYSGGVASCSAVITATHWMPLPAPPTTDITHASHSVLRLGHAEVGDADQRGRRDDQPEPGAVLEARRTAGCRARCRRPRRDSSTPKPALVVSSDSLA